MNTIISVVEQNIYQQPFLSRMLVDELINLSSLARQLKPHVDKELKKDIKTGSIVMALKRLTPILQGQSMIQTNRVSNIYVNLTVRSNLFISTFENSKTIVLANLELLEKLSGEKDFFHTVSCGIFETSIVVSEQYENIMEEIFKSENLIVKMGNLSSITINLDRIFSDTPGLYFNIFSKIAWLGISIKEIVSTSHEISLIIDDKDTGITYNCIKELFAYRDKN